MFIILFAALSESSGLTIHQFYVSYTFDTIYHWNYWKLLSSLHQTVPKVGYCLLLLVERQIEIDIKFNMLSWC